MASGFDLGSVFVTFKANVDDFAAGINSAKKSIGDVGETLNKLGDVSLVVGGVITGALGFAVKSASELQVAQVGVTQTLNALKQAGIENSASTADNAQQTSLLTSKAALLTAQMKKQSDIIDGTTKVQGDQAAAMTVAQSTYDQYSAQLQQVNQKLTDFKQAQQLATLDIPETTKKINELAEANTALGFDDNDTLKSLQMLLPVFKNVNDAASANALAMDLARSKGIDLASATNLVAMAYEGNGKALKAYGINIKDTATTQEALNELQQQVSGQAAAYTTTFAGQMTVVKVKLEDIAQTIGMQLLPQLTGFLTQVSGIIKQVTDWMQQNPALVSQILRIAAVTGPVLVAFGTLLKIVAAIIKILPILQGIWTALAATVTFLVSPLGLVLLAIVALGVAAYEAYKHWDQIKALFMQLAPILNAIVGWFHKTEDSITDFFASAKRTLQNFEAFLKGIWLSVANYFKSMWDSLVSVAKAAWPIIVQVVTDLWVAITLPARIAYAAIYLVLYGLFEVFQYIWSLIGDTVISVVTSIWNFLVATFTAIYDFLVKATTAYVNWWIGQLTAIWNGVVAVFTAVYNFFVQIWNAIYNVASVVGGAIRDFIISVFNAVKGPISDALNWVKNTAMSIWSAVAGFFVGSYDSIKGALTKPFEDAKASITGILNGIASAVGGWYSVIKTSIGNTLNSIVDGINKLVETYNDLPGTPNLPSIPHFAAGVTNFGGGMAMVGDVMGTNSGELINLPAGSSVYSNAQSKAMLSKPSTTNNYSITLKTGAIMGTPGEARQFVQTIADGLDNLNTISGGKK